MRSIFWGALLSGVLLGGAALVPDSLWAIVLATLAILGMLATYRFSEKKVLHLFTYGLFFSLTAFYWLPDTITLFGGFPTALSYVVFLLFASTSAIQFALAAYLAKRFSDPEEFQWWIFPFFWFLGEFLFPRMFPWGLAHNFLAWKSFASLAGLFGTYPLSLLLVLCLAYLLDLVISIIENGGIPHDRLLKLFSGIFLFLALGAYRHNLVFEESRTSPEVKIGLIQGNFAAAVGADPRNLPVIVQRYRELSQVAESKGAQLLLWPESVINSWIETQFQGRSIRGTGKEPLLTPGRIIYGGMSFEHKPASEIEALRRGGYLLDEEDEYEKYNSALGVQDGRVLGMYHKRALMPFGEYLPLASTFPSLRKLSPLSGNLSAGKSLSPLSFAETKSESGEVVFPEVRAGVLICYEDLMSGLSRQYAKLDANILVNLTNDAWYGYSHAQKQHSMLAAWRSIESKRALARATNTGYSVVYGPGGETLKAIPLYRPGFEVVAVPLLSDLSLYDVVGDAPSWIILLLGCFFIIRSRRFIATS